MEIRHLRDDEFEQAIKLSDATFREEGHISMGEAFPQVFSRALKQSYGAFDGEKLVSFVGLVPAKIHIGPAVLNVFLIGSVCTAPEYRGQGLATAVLEKIYQHIKKANGSLLFVSGGRGLYRRLGCYEFGGMYQFRWQSPGELAHSFSGKVRQADPVDLFYLDELREQKSVRFDASLWEWAELVKAGGLASIYKLTQEVFVAEKDGVPVAYIVVGLPTPHHTEGKAMITEWAGDPEAIKALVQQVLSEQKVSTVTMNIPWHEPLLKDFRQYPHKKKNHSGTIHIIDAQNLFAQLQPYFSASYGGKIKISVDNEGDDYVLAVDEREIVLTEERFVSLLFTPGAMEPSSFEGIFPIPLPDTLGLYFV